MVMYRHLLLDSFRHAGLLCIVHRLLSLPHLSIGFVFVARQAQVIQDVIEAMSRQAEGLDALLQCPIEYPIKLSM
jgi:hypothetical protein